MAENEQIVKVYNPKGTGWLGTQYEINGNEVPGVKGVDFRVAVDEVPRFTFEMFGLPEIEMSGEIRFSFTPQTVAEAATVIQKEFRRDTECYKALVASIESAIVENEDRYELAQDIADRILGIDAENQKE